MKIYDYNGKKNVSGDRIREARLKRRLTQEDFAAKLQIAGVTIERDSISRIEIGTRFVADYELMIISEVLGVTVEWLLSTDDEYTNHRKPGGLFFYPEMLDNILTVVYNTGQEVIEYSKGADKRKQTLQSESIRQN